MQSRPSYRCLFNHDLFVPFITESPAQSYREEVKSSYIRSCVTELADTQVDALLCCPTPWGTPLYRSEVDPKWQDEAPKQIEPPGEADWKFYEKVYYRIRRYMLAGNKDPVQITADAAREIGVDFFLSYRMNDRHFVNIPDCPTHSSFWRSRRDLHLDPGGSQWNYLEPEVRRWYLALLDELVERYDIDGLELDFMRSPRFFPSDRIEEGRAVMNELIRSIRRRLDHLSSSRGKPVRLGVRIPAQYDLCRKVGLEPETWAREGLIDMANLAPRLRNTVEVDVGRYRRQLPDVAVYGEMHFITQDGATADGHTNNILRNTTREIYETTALSFLDRGADGVSLFNFAYTRENSFRDPRRKQYPGIEPDFEVLKRIADEEYLRRRPRHYLIPAEQDLSSSSMPVDIAPGSTALVALHVADRDTELADRTERVVRLESDGEIVGMPVELSANGNRASAFHDQGEFFPPFSAEAIPCYYQLLFFRVPPEAIRHGVNEFTVTNRSADRSLHLVGFELKLARDR